MYSQVHTATMRTHEHVISSTYVKKTRLNPTTMSTKLSVITKDTKSESDEGYSELERSPVPFQKDKITLPNLYLINDGNSI